MSTKNDITGDSLTSRPNNGAYRENYDKIFSKNKPIDNSLALKIEQHKGQTNPREKTVKPN